MEIVSGAQAELARAHVPPASIVPQDRAWRTIHVPRVPKTNIVKMELV